MKTEDRSSKHYLPYFFIWFNSKRMANRKRQDVGTNGVHCTQWFLIWLLFHLLFVRFSQHRNLFSLILIICMLCCLCLCHCFCLGIYWSSQLWLGCILPLWMWRTEWKDRRSKTERDAQNWFLQRKKKPVENIADDSYREQRKTTSQHIDLNKKYTPFWRYNIHQALWV